MKSLRGLPSGVLRHLRRGAAAYGVLLISLVLTALAWHYVRENVDLQNRARFRDTVQAAQQAIGRRTASYVDALFGARGLFFASDSVTQEEWSGYVQGIAPKDRFEGLQALGFTEYVTPEEREDFFLDARGRGLPPLRPDLDPGGERSAYFPLTFVEPLDAANRSRINHDAYTDPAHRAAMERARDTGEPAATSRVYVLAEAGAGADAALSLKPGFVIYLPVYERGEPTSSAAERRDALEGFVVGYFRMDGLIDSVFGEGFNPAIDFEVYDGPNIAESALLSDGDSVERARGEESPGMYTSTRKMEVAGRDWTLFFASLPGFDKGATSRLPLFVILNGIIISFLLFSITWLLVRSRDRAERASEDLEEANRELESTNRELEAFSYSVSHDLRAPLRTIDGFSRILLEDYGDRLDAEGEDYLGRVRGASQHMGDLIDDLLNLSRVTRSPLRRETVDLSAMVRSIIDALRREEPEREVEFVVEEDLKAQGDANLLSVALENLLGNAWKFTSREPDARIEFGAVDAAPGTQAPVYYVRDNGAGFDMAYAERLFGAFQRLHGAGEFEGTGIGLATVQRIIHRHGGRVWAEGEVGEGAIFYFTLGGARGATETPAKRTEVA